MPQSENQLLPVADLISRGGTLHLGNQGSEDWREITEASLDEYRNHHQAGAYPPAILEIMSMFEGFIAKWAGIWGAENVIDLGCGIGQELPPYVRNIAGNLHYVGLDPLDENPERDYPFICGRLEDLAGRKLDKKFDLALFATSLDHFEDARNALSLAAEITNGGRAVILCGLHDSSLIARNDLSTWIEDLCRNNQSTLNRILAFWAYTIGNWPRVARALARREKKLAADQPLDNLHFHYFTEQSLRTLLGEAGTIHELTLCPGSNGAFAAVTLSPKSKKPTPHDNS